jgi:hypothetical protein
MSHTELLKLFTTLEKITTTSARTTKSMVKTALIKIWRINNNSATPLPAYLISEVTH